MRRKARRGKALANVSCAGGECAVFDFATSPGFRSNVGVALTSIVASSTDAQSKCDERGRHSRVQMKKKRWLAQASCRMIQTKISRRNARVAEKCFEAGRSSMLFLLSGESTKAILAHWSATLRAGHLEAIKGRSVRQSVGCTFGRSEK